MRWFCVLFPVLLCSYATAGPKDRQGDIEVEVVSTETETVRLTGGGLSERPVYQVRLAIRNLGQSAVSYDGWAMREDESNRETAATLRFGLSGIASPVVFNGSRPFGQSVGQVIPPGGTLTDLLIFEPPAPSGTLGLNLPGRAIGSTSDFRLRFPVTVTAPPPTVEKPVELPTEPSSDPPVEAPKPPEVSEEDVQKRVEELEDVGEVVAWGIGFILFMGLLGFLAYFAPLGIAIIRSHHQTAAIAVINIFLGWSFIGWIVALAMAFSATDGPNRGGRRSRYDDDDY